MAKARILYADDEERMRELVSDFLTAGGYEVVTVPDGRGAVDTFVSDGGFDLVILDIMMPHMDGHEALKEIKKEDPKVLTILLTAKSGEYDELLGFSLGVDEYIKKPFAPKVLVARVSALLKRIGDEGDAGGVYEAFGVRVDTASREVTVEGREITLTGKEYEMLLFFIRNKGIAFTRDRILNAVWDYDYEGDRRTVDTFVKTLRSKLGNKGSLIQTVWSVGYKFEGP